MRAKAAAAILAAALAVVLALPAGAAATKTFHLPAQVTAEVSGHGTHGFSFILLSFGRGDLLLFSKGDGLGEEGVDYSSFQRHPTAGLDQGRLDVKVGKLGHFRGHFVTTSTKVHKLEDRCKGEPTTVESGYFEGSFVFHGERGFTSVQAPRLKGSITRQGALDCAFGEAVHGHGNEGRRVESQEVGGGEGPEFHLLAGEESADLLLQANRDTGPSGSPIGVTTNFEVSDRSGKAGAFQVDRSASVFATRAADAFRVPNLAEPLAEATLEPPAPFSGTATFKLEGPQTASWTGDLTVELPGLAKLPLTGKKILAGICKGRTNCTDTLPGLLGELLEAGGDGSSVIEATAKRGS
jgi:hypothetical protein